MDFGVVGLEGFVGSAGATTTTAGFTTSSLASDPESKQKWYGSGFPKQERSGNNEDEWRSSKLAKIDDFSPSSKAMLLQHRNTSLLRSNATSIFSDAQQQQQMLSFSAPKSEAPSLDRSSQNLTFPYFHLTSTAYTRNTVYNTGGFNGANMHGVLAAARGPFTPSQWMELEHQALIFKYITANVPIPSNLLVPIRKALDSADFSSFSGGLLRPNSLGWGAFHLGFSNSTDPEPGRCRRTDGKKWRCSRDAVADQKYCERHMNRGRHRSRKPVEGQSGHSAAATTATTTNKLMPAVSSSSSASMVVGPVSGGGESNSLAIAQQQFKNLQPSGASNLSAAPPLNRLILDKDTVERMHDNVSGLSMISPTGDLKSKENPFLVPKQHISYEEDSRNEFGVVSSDSLLNPTHKSSFLINKCRDFSSSQGTESQQSLRQFMDDWPKSQSDRSAISWPKVDVQSSDRTQLSISIPMGASDFMSSTSSPNNEKVTLSPLRLSREFDPIHMGLGVGSVINEQNQRQANWIPISWETSMGGPLGEALNSTNSSMAECKNSSALNLMTEGWDNSPRLGSSPTGVLQKTTFGSLSNSSAGSSPRADNHKTQEGASLCNDLLGPTLVHSSSLPAL